MVCQRSSFFSPVAFKFQQNFGILMAFLSAFIAALLIFSEYNTATSFDAVRVLFMRGSKSLVIQEAKAATDEEKSLASTQPVGDQDSQETKKALAEHPPMNTVFSWQNVQYSVHVSGGNRLLLDNVSGYVAPGKLTALMGESGAGKVNWDQQFKFLLRADQYHFRLRFLTC
jgi:ATP-binding cassette, subfamily G (WHITE), member 2, SNQ2